VQESADQAIASGAPTVEAIRTTVLAMATLARTEQPLTVAFIGAVSEVTNRVGAPVSENDPRVLVPFPRPLRDLIAEGQRRGELTSQVDALDASVFMTNAMFLRVVTRRVETAQQTADLTLTFLLGGLLPR
jgi:hypothetical protein